MSDLAIDSSFYPVENSASSAVVVAPKAWTAGTRLAFRFAFCHFIIFAFCCGNATVWEALIPVAGGFLSGWLNWPFLHAAHWLGLHVFHLQGVSATLHDGGSGDKAIDWLSILVMFVTALVATTLWTVADEAIERGRRLSYPQLFVWFRFTVRLTLGVSMFLYGMDKVFPLQMAPPSLAVLNEPLGNTSPMTMLWTLIGLNPGYEMVCGAAEVVAGVLILWRRTALLGALITAFVVTNVVLYNLFFDVPVKIYAIHLLLMSLVVITPDVRLLFRFFWLHEPVSPTTLWAPSSDRKWLRRTIAIIEGWIFTVVGIGLPIALGFRYLQQWNSLHHPSAFVGQWHVDTATMNGRPKPYLTGDSQPMTDIFMEPSGRTMLRDATNVLWRGNILIDDKKHTLKLGSTGHEGSVDYAISQPDASHLVLTPTGKEAKTEAVVSLSRVPLPAHYPLLDRGFHWINEWGLER
jgi:hypothetical protein